jgi:hypothetical protein
MTTHYSPAVHSGAEMLATITARTQAGGGKFVHAEDVVAEVLNAALSDDEGLGMVMHNIDYVNTNGANGTPRMTGESMALAMQEWFLAEQEVRDRWRALASGLRVVLTMTIPGPRKP